MYARTFDIRRADLSVAKQDLAGAPRTVTDKLQRVLNAAARVVTGTRKFDRGLGQILHKELHWLDVPDWVIFKLAVTVYRCGV